MNRVRHVFSSRARTTWVELQPLDLNALGLLVSMTLQRPKEDIAPFTRVVARVSNGNPFQARNLLLMVRRQGHVSNRLSLLKPLLSFCLCLYLIG
jgi:predicted ATPase